MSAIRPGDLVWIAKPKACCGFAGGVGKMFVVMVIRSAPVGVQCPQCGVLRTRVGLVVERTDRPVGPHGLRYVVEMDRLQKIDPQKESDAIPAAKPEEVTA